jgi:hypothetical protein
MKSDQAIIETIFSDLKKNGELKESDDIRELEATMRQLKLQIERCSKITQAILKFGRQSRPSLRTWTWVALSRDDLWWPRRRAFKGSAEGRDREGTPLVRSILPNSASLAESFQQRDRRHHGDTVPRVESSPSRQALTRMEGSRFR